MALNTPVLSATGVVSLGTGSSGNKVVSRIVAQVVGSAWTGSAVPKVRIAGAGLAAANLKTIPYVNVATGTPVAAGTAITTDGVFEFPANGLEIVLDYTHTSGSASVYTIPMEGAGSGVSSAAALFNETSTDLQRGNTAATLFTSAARTASPGSVAATNYNARFAQILLNVTAASGTGGLTMIVEGLDVPSNVWYTIIQSVLVTTVTTVLLRVGPGLTAANNLVANDVLPRNFRVRMTHGDASSYTYSVGVNLIV